MKLSSILKGVKTLNAFEDVEIEKVTDKDTEIAENTLFVCIDGLRTDGHTVGASAVKKGASVLLTERDLGIKNQIIVEDTRKAYSLIASNFYGNPSKNLKLIGVTGTNGKTSTCFFIKDLLEGMGVPCGLIGTVNNYCNGETDEATLTTPEPMELHRLFSRMVENGCEYCVMEVSSQALSQMRVWGLNFKVAVITNITPEHLDYHIDMDSYIKAKMSILNQAENVIVNIDDENIRNNLKETKCLIKSVSVIDNSADFVAKNIECSKTGVKYLVVGNDFIERIKLKVIGKFSVYNSLFAAAAVNALGFPIEKTVSAFGNVKSVKGRMEQIEASKNFEVYIDYAHTPDSLANAISAVREFTTGRVIIVFGCGGDRDKQKRSVMGKIAGENADIVVVTTDNPRNENSLLIINDILKGMEHTASKVAVVENRRDAIEYALKKARRNDTVLIAGKGHEEYQIVNNNKLPFNERKIVEEFFKT